jgi:hypothetical protein
MGHLVVEVVVVPFSPVEHRPDLPALMAALGQVSLK